MKSLSLFIWLAMVAPAVAQDPQPSRPLKESTRFELLFLNKTDLPEGLSEETDFYENIAHLFLEEVANHGGAAQSVAWLGLVDRDSRTIGKVEDTRGVLPKEENAITFFQTIFLGSRPNHSPPSNTGESTPWGRISVAIVTLIAVVCLLVSMLYGPGRIKKFMKVHRALRMVTFSLLLLIGIAVFGISAVFLFESPDSPLNQTSEKISRWQVNDAKPIGSESLVYVEEWQSNTRKGVVQNTRKIDYFFRIHRIVGMLTIGLTAEKPPRTEDLGERLTAKIVERIDLFLKVEDLLEKAYSKRATGDLVGAIDILSKAIVLTPTDADLLLERGNAHFHNGDLAAAAEDYTAAIKLTSDYVEAYGNRALARNRLGDQAGAMADHNEAVHLSPRSAWAHQNRACSWLDQGIAEKAIEDFTQCIALNPKDGHAYANRGAARHRLLDFKGAIEDFTQAIQLAPQWTECYERRGFAHVDAHAWKDALADVERACDLESPNRDLLELFRWILLVRLGDRPTADATLTSYLHDRKPVELETFYLHIGSFLLDRISAEDLLKAAGEEQVALCQAYYYMALKHEMNGAPERVLECLRKSVAAGKTLLPRLLREHRSALAELKRSEKK